MPARHTPGVVTSVRSAKIRIKKVAAELQRLYPDAICELNYNSPLELMIATILSAQCTDKKVNDVTPALFAKYPTATAYANADVRALENVIRAIGLYRMKAKNIIANAKLLLRDYQGEVPGSIETLVKLPGVGRKTANCVLVNAFDLPGIMCDTHTIRLSNRLGFIAETNADKVEMLLKDMLPAAAWGEFSHRLIWHGRRVCEARKPQCDDCTLRRWCDAGGRKPNPPTA